MFPQWGPVAYCFIIFCKKPVSCPSKNNLACWISGILSQSFPRAWMISSLTLWSMGLNVLWGRSYTRHHQRTHQSDDFSAVSHRVQRSLLKESWLLPASDTRTQTHTPTNTHHCQCHERIRVWVTVMLQHIFPPLCPDAEKTQTACAESVSVLTSAGELQQILLWDSFPVSHVHLLTSLSLQCW